MNFPDGAVNDSNGGAVCAPNDGNCAHSYAFDDIDGVSLPLVDYTGRPILVVNTASRCGLTPHYAGLQTLWDRYKGQGLMVIGVPSNDFGRQEPGPESEIRAFCDAQFGISFPLTRKISVRGPNAHPWYRWAASQTGLLGRPYWNFHKYLVDPNGRMANWFSSVTPPLSRRLTDAIERLLPPVGKLRQK
jgi:glutathione peroxidase